MKKRKIIEYIIVIFTIGMIPILSMNNIGIPCIYNKITGLYCPGCGITRAVISLMKFDIKSALGYNCFFVIVVPIMIVFYIYDYLKRKNDSNYDYKKFNKVWYMFLVMLILFGILRNISLFRVLAP